MRIVTFKRIKEFRAKHSDAEASLVAWCNVTKKAAWEKFTGVRGTFPSADEAGRKTVFDIAHKRYRLIARINYKRKLVYVLHILTHKDDDKGDWKK